MLLIQSIHQTNNSPPYKHKVDILVFNIQSKTYLFESTVLKTYFIDGQYLKNFEDQLASVSDSLIYSKGLSIDSVPYKSSKYIALLHF